MLEAKSPRPRAVQAVGNRALSAFHPLEPIRSFVGCYGRAAFAEFKGFGFEGLEFGFLKPDHRSFSESGRTNVPKCPRADSTILTMDRTHRALRRIPWRAFATVAARSRTASPRAPELDRNSKGALDESPRARSAWTSCPRRQAARSASPRPGKGLRSCSKSHSWTSHGPKARHLSGCC